MVDASIKKQTARTIIALALLIAPPACAAVEKTRHLPLHEQDDLRVQAGYNHLLSLSPDRAILAFTGPLIEELSAPQPEPRKTARLLTLIGRSFDFDDNAKAASICYANALALDPDYMPARAFLGITLLGSDRDKELVEKLRSLADSDISAAMYMGQRAMKLANFKAARHYFKQAVDLDPALAASRRLLGKCYASRGFSTEAAAEYETAAALEESEYLKELLAGKAAELKEKYKTAEKHYLAASKILPGDPSCHYMLFFNYLDRNKKNQAMSEIEKTADCRRLSLKALNTLALYYAYNNRTGQARNILNYAEMLSPESSGPVFTRGHYYLVKRKPKLAIGQFRKAISKDHLNLWAYYGLAEQLRGLSKTDEARSVITRCLSRSPAFFKGWLFLGDLEKSKKHWAKALKAYKKIEPRADKDSTRKDLDLTRRAEIALLYAHMAFCHFNSKDRPQALEKAIAFNQVKPLSVKQKSIKALSVRPGRLKFNDQSNEDHQKKAVEYVFLADMLYENGDLDECCNQYRQALALDPENVEFRKYFFHALVQNKQWMEAAREDIIISNQIVKNAPTYLKKASDAVSGAGKKKKDGPPRAHADPVKQPASDSETKPVKGFPDSFTFEGK